MSVDKIKEILDLIYKILVEIYEKFVNFTGEQIALLSIIVTLILYVLGKRSELNLKKHESKKQEYVKLIDLLEKIYSLASSKDKTENLELTPEMRREFFHLGSSLLLYGSKKLYKQYIFYRELSSNLIIQGSKYFNADIITYVMANMLTTIRKEVGLNRLDSITSTDSLAFFINDIANNPFSKIKSYNAQYNIRMIKFELFMADIEELVFIHYLFNCFIKPIWGTLELILKYLLLIPVGKIINKLFPNFKPKGFVPNNETNKDQNKNV